MLNALLVLACGQGSVDDRLRSAYQMALRSIDPQLDLPPELKDEFIKIRDELQKEFLLAAAGKVDGELKPWASAMAKRIVAFYDCTARYK